MSSAKKKADSDLKKKCAKIIQTRKLRGIQDKFEMGDALLAADASEKEPGEFTKWLSNEFKMSRTSATKLENLAKAVAPENRDTVANNFDVGALYELTKTDKAAKALAAAIEAAREGEHITVRIAKELLQDTAQQARETGVVTLPDSIRIECRDLRDWDLEPGSVDLLLCDLPYDEKSVPLYGQLARLAAACLRDGGWCLAYAGKMYLARIHYLMKQSLSYGFQFDVPHKKPTLIKSLQIVQNAKVVLGYRHMPGDPWWRPVSDRLEFEPEKDLHPWQQPVDEARALIEALCPKGGIVFDPACGTGTTVIAALMAGRQVVAGDIDPKMVALSRKRVAEFLNDEHVA